ncbi:hypothetical protein Psal027_03702 (plasmid) [Piscirickettsia salmonis]|uniref:hypothetical protein n=1 Tax=Piscirickettsia salmonis TaxID=1238 RepID=UPI00031A010E|nr:hypothetical protein [Piscirickettsia salmonis]ERL61756.1 hypothetical protein K661_01898 [Piscirickettsia salmonis LF-89 = ATCC VR-1361]PEQ17304.1 hypothetical protein X973_02460 [Piscirickettsia salmonis]QGN79391.1 hypothetical protein Psal001_03656 [Piscirickettsia salmonis]QGN82980.1 hypothetical protein Psal002_03680 [Piscirickettsia salmonis]QGN86495.1 hypothetical protein Psal003_03604 [Piscirickettsia salmonis]
MIDHEENALLEAYLYFNYGSKTIDQMSEEIGKSHSAIKMAIHREKSKGFLKKNEKEHARMLLNEKKEEIKVLQSTIKFYQSVCKEFALLSEVVLKQVNSQ